MASFLSNLFGGGAGAEAAEANRTAYGKYGQEGAGFLDKGLEQSSNWLLNAKGEYAPLSALASQYGKGTDMRMNALGLNGADGSAAARSAFTTSPAYDFTLDTGIDTLNRRRAAGGMFNSGNADIDALKFGTGLASGEWNNWLSSLSDVDKQNLSTTGTVAAGRAGTDMSLANLYQTDATNRVNLNGTVTSGIAGANNQQAAAETAGSRNLFGALMSGATALAGGLGGGSFGFGGSGGLGSSLGSLGVTYGSPGTMFSNMQGPVR